MKFFGTKDIKHFVKKHLIHSQAVLRGKTIIDIPAGSGYTSQILKDLNLSVEAYDLFPEFFQVEGLSCGFADLSAKLPIADKHADYVICQEGIEHLPDQLYAFKEFNRITKSGGTLLITTPNYSNLRGRFSYFLAESEYFYKIMPPNELDSIWFSTKEQANLYLGHIFLIGIQKMRVLARIAGFRIKKVHHLRVNHTALFLLLLAYPWIWLTNTLAYLRARKKYKGKDKEIYREVYKLSINPAILVDGHLFVEFTKENELNEVETLLFNKYKTAQIQT